MTVTLKSESTQSVRDGNSGKGWSESSSVEFEENIEANSFAFSDDAEITSGPLMMVGIGDFPRFRTLLVILQNSRDPSPSCSILVWTDSA